MKAEQLDFDTDLFGYKVGAIRVEGVMPDALQLSRLLDYSDNKLTYVFLEDAAGLPGEQREALQELLVTKGCLLADEKMFFHSLDVQPRADVDEPVIVKGEGADLEALYSLGILAGRYSRFRTDPGFKADECSHLYRAWVNRSITHQVADEMYVCMADAVAAAMMSVRNKKDGLSIELLAVDPKYQRRGFGASLIDAARRYAFQHKIKRLVTSTQADNIEARRFYLAQGFENYRTDYVYHFWR